MVEDLRLDFVLGERGHLVHQNRWGAAEQTRIGVHGERASRAASAINNQLPRDRNEAAAHIHDAKIDRA